MSSADVAVIGAGVAGLAAAVALAADGAKVTLLERRPLIGGRAYSYRHPALEETVDSQHVLLGCCTNLVELLTQAGAAETIRWYDELCFLEPRPAHTAARRSFLRRGDLPAPMHQAMSFVRAPMLGLNDKAAIAAGLMRFLQGPPAEDSESFAGWLQRTGQTQRAIRHFWEPVVVGALNDSFERCSVKYAAKVFHESFLRSPEGGRLGIPARPLSEFFAPVADLARGLGVAVHLGAAVERMERTRDGRWLLHTGAGEFSAADVLLACDLRGTERLLAGSQISPAPEFSKFVVAPITTVHLWYDREVVDLDHAVLLDTRIQWMFAKSRIRRWPEERGSYLELVISASWPELELERDAILRPALREFELFFPAVRDATLVKSAVLKEARATFSVTPGLDEFRPTQRTGTPGLWLAGDWTATGWPSTMEGAVRSGRMAAGELAGDRNRFLAPELCPAGLMRWFGR